jgi:HAD superfamily hydrolase (TIGR01509 family)
VITGVVFDFDGLILDTEMPSYLSWLEVFERFGCELDEDEHAMTIGAHFNRWDLLVERATVPLPPREEIVAAKNQRHHELIGQAVVQPGVVDWLDQAAAAGLPMAIASSSDSSWVRGHLERLGLLDRFASISCCENGVPPKPAPDCYLTACAAIHVAPANALAVEDSANGVHAAKAAGMWCVAVPNPLTRRLDLSAADLQLESLADITLAEVLQSIAERG